MSNSNNKKVAEKNINDKSLNADDMSNWIEDIQGIMTAFANMADSLNRPSDRRRKLGSGIRRYGFIDKTSDLADVSPQFSPAYFNNNELKALIRDIELSRNLLNVLQQFSRVVSDSLLLYGDEAFSMALLYYNSVKELARRNVPGAEAVFRALEPFFRRPRHTAGEPTEHEVERDIRALLHGKKDGQIIVENERPHMTGGEHVVVDETHKSHERFKETESGEVDE